MRHFIGTYWKKLGPGLTTGAADDDPAGIATYSQAGANNGLGFLWMAFFTYPLMATAQEMCARIGMVTGQGLASNIRLYYPKWLLYILTFFLFAANAFNIGADLGAMAESVRLLIPSLSNTLLIVFFTFFTLALQIFMSYQRYSRYLKWLALVLLSYIATAFILHIDWRLVLFNAVVPNINFSRDSWLLIAAILGTTISPYLFFWQTSQEVEEKQLAHGALSTSGEAPPDIITKEQLATMRVDVSSGMFVSNIVMFFIIVVCASTLFTHGFHNIQTAADAATALKPFAGNLAYLLFAVGIIGSGLLAVPILAGSVSYAISESLKWKSGLSNKFSEAHAFYSIIILAMLVGFVLNFIGLDPIKALIYSAVANCIVAPLVLILVVRLASNKEVMGENVNTTFTTIIGWVLVLVMTAASIGILVTLP